MAATGRRWTAASSSHFARGFLAHGVALAVPSYDLCPAVTLATIVDADARGRACCCTAAPGAGILAIGHSAGGHLSAMLMATDWPALDARLPRRPGAAGLAISGVFELEPLLPTTIGAGLRLSPEEARALSPRFLPPPGGALHAVVGGAESDEFIRQTRDFADRLGRHGGGAAGRRTTSPSLAALTDPDGGLARRAAAMAMARQARVPCGPGRFKLKGPRRTSRRGAGDDDDQARHSGRGHGGRDGAAGAAWRARPGDAA